MSQVMPESSVRKILHILTANTQYQGTLPYNIFIHCILYHKSQNKSSIKKNPIGISSNRVKKAKY